MRASRISGNLNADRTSVTKTVRRLFGKPLKAVLLERQHAYAARLLGVTDLTIPEIVETAGFGSRITFHRIFKRAFGMSPLQYRRQASGRK